MRLVLAVVSVLVLVGAGPATSAPSRCTADLPKMAAGPPHTVVVTTHCGRFRLQPNGGVVYAGKWKSPVPPVARGYWPDDLAWYGLSHGHVLIGRGMKQLWRSHDTYARGRYLDVGSVVLGRRALAFSYYRRRQSHLLVARYDGVEREVGRGEVPLLFSEGHLVAWREHGESLLLRKDSTTRVVAHAVAPQVDRESRMVVFRDDGELYAFDGSRMRDLASLRKLGLKGAPAVDLLGRLVAVHDRRRLVVLDYEGRRFASAALPKSRRYDGVSSPVVASSAGTALAFSVTSGNRSRETVYVLAEGKNRARPLFTESLAGGSGCSSDWLGWRGKWLLYANGTHQAAVLDSSGRAPPLELGDVIAKLPGIQTNGEGAFNVEWA